MPFAVSHPRSRTRSRAAGLLLALLVTTAAALAGAASARAATCVHTLTDADGRAWGTNVYNEYVTNNFDGLDGSYIGFDRDQDTSYRHNANDACTLEDGDREVVYPQSDQETARLPAGLEYRGKIFVPATAPAFVRHLHIFRNASDRPLSTQLWVYWLSEFAADTQVVTTSSGDDLGTAGDEWMTLENGADASDPRPALIWEGTDSRQSGFGPDHVTEWNTRVTGDAFNDGENEPYLGWHSITLAPGETQIFMDVKAVRDTAAEAESAARDVAGNAEPVFAGMSPEEKLALQNFLPPDVDSDGVGNDTDNCLRVANADQLNTDGAADGGDACDADDDNDELTDEVELAIGTNQRAADTDADGVRDKADQCPTQAGDQANGCRSEDRPPTVSFTAPADNTRLNPAGANTLAADAADDRGVGRVVFVDDGRVVCSDPVAPYRCDYAPDGRDVGANTLSAVAVDSSGQTATAFRELRLDRFSPRRVTARTTPSHDRSFPFRFTTTGRVVLPARVTRSQGCKGRVSVQIMAAKNTISTRRTTLTRACTYRSRVTFTVPRKFYSRKLKVQVRFLGNAVLKARRAPARFATVG